jgi:nucleoside-diphosphate-sugar epimerase
LQKLCVMHTLNRFVLLSLTQKNLFGLFFKEGISIRIARIFNTYGPRMHMNDGRVVSNFVLQALQNEPITVK